MKDTITPEEDDNITELSSLIDPPSPMVSEAQPDSLSSNSTESESLAMTSSSSHETIVIAIDMVEDSTAVSADAAVIEITSGDIINDGASVSSSVENLPSMQETKITDIEESNLGVDQLPVVTGLEVAEDSVSRISSIQGDMCRICHCIADDESEMMISPCDCCGSMKWVHQKCLQRWVKSRDAKKCELCGYSFNMTSSVKPFRKWKKLNMSSVERRRVLCSVTFHVVAITCVIWSLYVLIDRTTTEIQQGDLNWPFWTKLVVVAIGFTGGLVFMYVQCKTYVKLFRRWKQFNRVIYINDIQLPDAGDKSPTVSIDMPTATTQDATVNINIDGQNDNPSTA